MDERKQAIEGVLYREMSIRNSAVIDEDERLVQVSASSELPVTRRSFFSDPWIETLGHKDDEVNLSRFESGASVHYNHSRNRADRIGVVESAQVRNKRVEATVRISKRADVDDLWTDIKDGVLRNISVGYTIEERTLTRESKGEPDEYRITSWTPMELSFVDIPADPTVGVGRNESGDLEYRVIDLDRSTQTMPGKRKGGDDNVTPLLPSNNEVLYAEQQRRREIDEIFSVFNDPATALVRDACKDDMSVTVDEARNRLLNALGRNSVPAQTRDALRIGEYRDDAHFSMSGNGNEFQRAAMDAILIRSGVSVEKPHPGARDLAGCSILDIARMHLGQTGVNTTGMPNVEVAKRAMSTSDFPLLLENTAGKGVIQGYNEAAGTHRGWARQSFARDFKPKSYVAAGEAPPLQLVTENAEITYGQLVETGTNVSLATYARLLSITRQAIINDDTGELMRSARSFGASAMRLESDISYGTLISNPVMQDGNPLFDASHNNIATAAVPSITSLGEMRQLLRNQKGLAGSSFLDLQPFAVLAPTTLETQLEQLLSSLFDPFPATTGDTNARNPFANRLELIVDPRLDVDSTTRWYLVTNPNVFNWSERIHLEGQPAPFVDEQNGWSIDGVEIKVRHDYAALITEYRGIVKNDGV